MSTFRPPQVPQQPPTYFTPGLPLGIPKACTDMQMQQIGAYYRQRPDAEAFEVATRVINRTVTAGTPFAYVPAPSLQIPFSARWPIEWIVENYWVEFTAGTSLGIPQPKQGEQGAAYWRQRPDTEALEAAADVVSVNLTPGTLLGVPQPVQGNQTAAYFRQRPQDEAAQEALGIVSPAFTPTPLLGVPNPVQGDQSAAYFRARPQDEAAQEAVGVVDPNFTQGQPLGVPNPAQTDQTQATWRVRAEIQQPQVFALPTTVVFVPAPDFFGFETTPDEPTLPPATYQTAGQPLGSPPPTQVDQAQATWRARVEIQQPTYFAPIPPPQFYAPRYEFQMAAYFPGHPIAIEILSEQLVSEYTPGLPLGVPQPKQSDQTAAYWRAHVEIPQTTVNAIPLPPLPSFVPALALQMPFGASARYETLIFQQQRQSIPAAAAPVVLRQSDQSAAYFWSRQEIQQPFRFVVAKPASIQGAGGQLIALQGDDRLIVVIDTGNRRFKFIAADRWVQVSDDDRLIQLNPGDRTFNLKGT